MSFATKPSPAERSTSSTAVVGRTRTGRSVCGPCVTPCESRSPRGQRSRCAAGRLNFVHPDSVLGCYLAGAPIASREPATTPIFPFRCTNAAVDNVREKLDELGFGHVIASLGRKEKREEFFAGQATRNARVTSFANGAPPAPPPPERMDELDRRLRRLQEAERARADLRRQVDAYRLELQHFERHLHRHEEPDLEGLPLLRRSSDRILDYLAESEVEHNRARPGLLRRIRKYFCNKAFYDGELIPFTTSDTKRPMIVWRTPEGNHMRQHRGGGRSNQREVDVIVNEVIPEHCAGVHSTDIGRRSSTAPWCRCSTCSTATTTTGCDRWRRG